MTDAELQYQRNIMQEAGCSRWRGTPEQKLLCCELDCVEMITSIIAYGGFGHTAEEILIAEETSSHNCLADYIKDLGRKRVKELIQIQLNDIIEIRHNVHTDSDGCTYNSVVWAR